MLVTTLNTILLNFALLVAGLFVVSLTYGQAKGREVWWHFLTRYCALVTTSFLLLYNSTMLGPDLLFDFRGVVVALAARRNGIVAGVLVAFPVCIYRLILGGPTAWTSVAHLLVVAILAGWPTGLWSLRPNVTEDLQRKWWVPARIYAVVGLGLFPAFHLVGEPLWMTLVVYSGFTVLNTLGMITGSVVIDTRLRALLRADELERLAFIDELTGSFNRRRFSADFRTAIQPAYLLLLDLDHFKRINDLYGHEWGDRVLMQTVQVIREAVRPTDGIYRLGGEEFAVLLSPCRSEMSSHVAERVRQAIEQEVALRALLPQENITVSGSLVIISGTQKEVMRKADELLYKAKQAGRNRVTATT